MMLPKTFSEIRLLLLYKKTSVGMSKRRYKGLLEKMTECFKEYCKPLTKPDISEVCTDLVEFRVIIHKLFILLGHCNYYRHCCHHDYTRWQSSCVANAVTYRRFTRSAQIDPEAFEFDAFCQLSIESHWLRVVPPQVTSCFLGIVLLTD